MASNCCGLFVTGTDTGVGKTYVSGIIAAFLVSQRKKVGVYKPAASGCVPNVHGKQYSEDAWRLWQMASCPGELDRVCPQMFTLPVAPHLAALAEGRTLDAGLLRSGFDYWRERSEIVVVEGAGGLMSPLGENEYVADLAADFGFPLVVVADNRLGTINATLQTLIAARTYRPGIPVAGVVLNHTTKNTGDDPSRATNGQEIARRCRSLKLPPLLTTVSYDSESHIDPPVDWAAIAQNV